MQEIAHEPLYDPSIQPSPIDIIKSPNPRFSNTERASMVLAWINSETQQEIADRFDCSQQYVSEVLEAFSCVFKRLPQSGMFPDLKQSLLDGTALNLLFAMNDEEKLARASVGNCAYAFKIMNEAGRLERGLSTSNISQHISFCDLTPPDLSTHKRKVY